MVHLGKSMSWNPPQDTDSQPCTQYLCCVWVEIGRVELDGLGLVWAGLISGIILYRLVCLPMMVVHLARQDFYGTVAVMTGVSQGRSRANRISNCSYVLASVALTFLASYLIQNAFRS